ncbi:hypothetical protein, partial [Klebsiella aerogenes]|uniref:hypothetical protein n=1 Tax=Klebsiella aerogenes TaxID=548 RepID=UPI001CC658E2
MSSASLAKHLMMNEEMEIMMEFQDLAGEGLALQALQDLWMNAKALVTLDRLWVCSRSLMIRSWDGLTVVVVMT